MHPSLITKMIRMTPGLMCLMLIASCTTPLPRLDDYSGFDSRSGSHEHQPNAWKIAEDGDLQKTLVLLLEDADPDVRTRAREVVRMLDLLAEERLSRLSEIIQEETDELSRASAWAMEGDEGDVLPLGVDPMTLRSQFVEDALKAERSGDFAKANKLAKAAMSMEWIVDDDVMIQQIVERPMMIAARNEDRMKNIRMVDPEIASNMTDPDGIDERIDVVVSKTDDPETVEESDRKRILNTARAIQYFEEYHVDEIDREVIHRAGFDELILISRSLAEQGHPIPEEFLDFLDESRDEIGDKTTLGLLIEIDSAQTELADGTLPDAYSMRVFGDGAAGALDKQTSVIWPREFEQYMKSNGRGYRGIGVQIKEDFKGNIVLRPTNGGPARKSGVRDGDILLEVDGGNIDEIGARGLAKIIDQEGRDQVDLLVRHEDGTKESIMVRLGPVATLNVTGWRQDGLDEDGLPTWWWLADDVKRIGYLRLARFAAGGERDVRRALQEAQRQALSCGGRLEGLVLDLRSNPGGQVVVAEEVINLFMGQGPIFRSIGRDGNMETEYADVNHAELEGLPLVVLVDELSASASEVVAGILKMNEKAIILGERTFGKGSIQGLVPAASENCLVRVTIGWYQLPNGKRSGEEWTFVDRDTSPGDWGVTPDIRISTSVEQTEQIINQRSMWHSGQGMDLQGEVDEMFEIVDPATELALALLGSRINDITR